MNSTFLRNLSMQHSANVIVTAEDNDFDDLVLRKLRLGGFCVKYVPMGEISGRAYASKLHEVAMEMTGVGNSFAIIAYGDAASEVLKTYLKSTPRLCAIIAYYPTVIPDPAKTHFPMSTSVLVHLAGNTVGIQKTPEVLGFQGKPKIVKRKIDECFAASGKLKLSFPAFRYSGVRPGFAEDDLEDFDAIAEDLAFSRTLVKLREAFGIKVDLETMRDNLASHNFSDRENYFGNASFDTPVVYMPTMKGGESLSEFVIFYKRLFNPRPADLKMRLVSRTSGADRVVDEISLTFCHDKVIPWLFPGIPASHKQVKIIVISIVCIRGGLLVSEHVYWDQASALVQIGLLDPSLVPKHYADKGVGRLPVSGAKAFNFIATENANLE